MKLGTEYFFRQYYRSLCHYAWQYLGDVDTSRDLVQDVFANFHARLGSMPPDVNEAYLKNYLFVATRNSCVNYNKKLKIIDRYWELNSFQDIDDSDLDLKMIRTEVMAALHRLLRLLPEGCRLVMHKAYIDGSSNMEIAAELNLSVNTVKTQKQRGVKFIKENLHPDLFIWFILFFYS